jgi:hypothetical protein
MALAPAQRLRHAMTARALAAALLMLLLAQPGAAQEEPAQATAPAAAASTPLVLPQGTHVAHWAPEWRAWYSVRAVPVGARPEQGAAPEAGSACSICIGHVPGTRGVAAAGKRLHSGRKRRVQSSPRRARVLTRRQRQSGAPPACLTQATRLACP